MDGISNKLNLNFILKTFFNDLICRAPVLIKLIVLLSLLLRDENYQVYGNSDASVNETEPPSRATNYNYGEWLNNALFESLSNYTPATSKLSTSNNSQCTDHGLLYRRHLRNLTMWAVQMYDSGVHSVGGILTADTFQLGHFDECLNVSYPAFDIKGKYCLVTLKFGPSYDAYKKFYSPPATAYITDPPADAIVWSKIKKTLDPRMKTRNEIHLAVCVPSSCSSDDIQNSMNFTISHTFHSHNLLGEIYLDNSSCYSKEDNVDDSGYFFMEYLLTTFLFIGLIATAYDYLIKDKDFLKIFTSPVPSNKLCNGNVESQQVEEKKQSKIEELVMAFSMRANMNELMEDGSDRALDVLNGGKFICLFVIIIGHRTLYVLGSALYNPEYWEESVVNIKHMSLMNGTQVVDTFFLIGGFLTFRGVFSHLEKGRKFNLPLLVFFRWLRFMPTYLVMMGIYALMLDHIGTGPVWNMKVGLESENCRESWWLNVLFINNYITPEKQCLLMSWYLACDMHFFIIGSCIVYLLWRVPRFAELICGVSLSVSLLIPFIQTYVGRHDGKLRLYQSLLRNPYVSQEFNSVYIRSHSRSIPYLFGVIIGYITHRMNKAKYTIPKHINIAGISIFFIMYLTQVYSLVIYTPGREYHAFENAILAAVLPLSWSIGSGWIMLVQCTTGLGLYKWLFAQKIYTPLSRLSYCAVLIHPAVQLVEAASVVSSEFLNYPKLIWMAFGDVSLSFSLALILYLMIESPFKNLQKLYLQPGGRKSSKPKTSVTKVEKNSENNEEQNHHQTVIPMTISSKNNDDNNYYSSTNGNAVNDNR